MRTQTFLNGFKLNTLLIIILLVVSLLNGNLLILEYSLSFLICVQILRTWYFYLNWKSLLKPQGLLMTRCSYGYFQGKKRLFETRCISVDEKFQDIRLNQSKISFSLNQNINTMKFCRNVSMANQSMHLNQQYDSQFTKEIINKENEIFDTQFQ